MSVLVVPPLHLAVAMGELELVEFLLDNGAKLELRDDDGDTALAVVATMCAAFDSDLLYD